MGDIYENIDEYNPIKKRKILIAFDDMIDWMLSNKKIQSIVTDLFIIYFYQKILFCCTKRH